MNLEKITQFLQKHRKRILRILSYVLVAVLTASVTVVILVGADSGQSISKLDALEKLIQECFIGDVDQTLIEDAAADAMVSALGDRWSYYIPADVYAAYQEQKQNA